MDKASVNVGLLGWGTVGTGVSKILLGQSGLISQNAGVELQLKKIAKRTLPALRDGIDLPDDCLTTDPSEVVDSPGIDIVVELIGGVTDSRDLISKAIRTANTLSRQTRLCWRSTGGRIVSACRRKPRQSQF